MKKINIKFQAIEIPVDEYNYLYSLCSNCNLLQNSNYILSKAKSDLLDFRFLKILNQDNKVVSITGVLLKRVLFFGSIARVNRGPSILKNAKNLVETNSELIYFKSILAIRDYGRAHRWLSLLLAPDFYFTDVQKSMLSRKFFLKRNLGSGYCSSIINLNLKEEELFGKLDSKWRNLLRKAIKFDLSINVWNGNSDDIEDLVCSYNQFQKERSFNGVSSVLINKLSSAENISHWSFDYFYVKEIDNNRIIGRLVSLIHGDTCTYFIGMTDEIGRKYNVNYLLLWHSILEAKNKGCNYYDLGGFNYKSTPSISKFKEGLNGEKFELIGEYITI